MTGVQLSLRDALRVRSADPTLGVRRLVASADGTIHLRSLIPPSSGGGGGGGAPGWLLVDSQNHMAPDFYAPGLMLCATTELFCWTDGQGAPIDVDNDPLQVGAPYWLWGIVHFPAVAPPFLGGVLPAQELSFALKAHLPAGTAPVDDTFWWIVEPEDTNDPPNQALILSPAGTTPPQTDWRLEVHAPTYPELCPFAWQLERGTKLAFHMCLASSLSFAAQSLSFEVLSQVGWTAAPVVVGDEIEMQAKREVFCLKCQKVVLIPVWGHDQCPICGATGTSIMKPVVPDSVAVHVPFGL